MHRTVFLPQTSGLFQFFPFLDNIAVGLERGHRMGATDFYLLAFVSHFKNLFRAEKKTSVAAAAFETFSQIMQTRHQKYKHIKPLFCPDTVDERTTRPGESFVLEMDLSEILNLFSIIFYDKQSYFNMTCIRGI